MSFLFSRELSYSLSHHSKFYNPFFKTRRWHPIPVAPAAEDGGSKQSRCCNAFWSLEESMLPTDLHLWKSKDLKSISGICVDLELRWCNEEMLSFWRLFHSTELSECFWIDCFVSICKRNIFIKYLFLQTTHTRPPPHMLSSQECFIFINVLANSLSYVLSESQQQNLALCCMSRKLTGQVQNAPLRERT